MSNVTATKKKNRIFYYDALRAFAIIFVILIHTSKWFAKSEPVHSLFWTFSSSLASLGNVGVPIFFMISGALLLNREYDDLGGFYKKRLSRLFVPFFFWMIFIIIFKISYLNYPPTIEGLIDIIFYKGFVWYVWTMMGIYLIAPVINSFIMEYDIRGVEYFLAIWLLTIILNTLGIYPIKNVELSYFAKFLGYFVLGWYLNNKKFSISNKAMMICSFIVFVVFSLITAYCIYLQLLDEVYYLTILPVIQAISFYLLFKSCDDYAKESDTSLTSKFVSFITNSKIGQIITSISICSYGMYLTHYFVIWIVKITNSQYHILLRNPFKWIPFIMLIAILFSWGLIWVCSKIPYLKKVSGT